MIDVALIGLGKIARDQHVPAIAESHDFQLAATVDPKAPALGSVPHFPDFAAMRAALPQITAVAVCTPPQVRASVAAAAIRAGLHVLLEKPPAASVSQARALALAASRSGVTLFAAWHSREAGGVAPARAWLADKQVRSINIRWCEDVRQWHPGQAWIWQPGGLGVFDPGINALSILTALLPGALVLDRAVLDVPANRAAPIAARLELRTDGGARVTADFDFRQTGQQTWEIAAETDAGTLLLEDGGSTLTLPGGEREISSASEYTALYTCFAELISRGKSDVDLAPFALVADAFLLGGWREVEPFYD
jgi:D-galactose 1-dehydrogenase